MWIDDFENKTGGGGGFDANNTTVTDSSKTVQRSRRLVPFFIKHMQLLSDDLSFFGQTIQMVEFYGILRSQVVSSTKIVYEIEDISDKIICHLWLDHDPDQQPNIPNLMLNSYCRVVGTLKSLSEGRRVMILKIRSMKDPNELVTFMLSAVCARYEIEKHARSLRDGDTTMNGKNSINIKSTDPGHDPNNTIGNPFQYKVYKAVEKFSVEAHGGVIPQIMKEVKCSQKELTDTLEFLINEGHVYTTIDDDHYKVSTM